MSLINLVVEFCADSEFDPVYVKHRAEYFFSRTLRDYLEDENSDYEISISEPKCLDIDPVYQSNWFYIEITLEYLTSPQPYGDIFSRIIKVWSQPILNNLSSLWLRLLKPSILYNNGKIQHTDIDIKEIAFGTFPDAHHFMQHYHYVSLCPSNKEIMGSFLHSQRSLKIYTCFSHSQKCINKSVHNRFQFSYQSIFRVVINHIPYPEENSINVDVVQIYFFLRHTPFLYVKKIQEKNKRDIPAATKLETEQEYRSHRWERTLDFGCDCKNSLCSVERIGRCPVFKIVTTVKHNTYSIIERLIQRCSSSTMFYFANVETKFLKFNEDKLNLKDFDLFPFDDKLLKKIILEEHLIADVKFKCQYAWEVVQCKTFETKDQMSMKYLKFPEVDCWKEFKRKLMSLFEISDELERYESIAKVTDSICYTLYDIGEMLNKNIMFSFEDAFEAFYKHHLKSSKEEQIPDGMCLVRRIVMTPSKILCIPPTEHFDNRIIRRFGVENLLRVSIQDDNFEKLTFAVQYNSQKRDFLKRVMVNFLLNGIEICPRKYETLASSNSQLREHGIWMYARDKMGNTAESIRKWMGDFSDIQNVPKYMARMGQCFSTSEESVQVELREKDVIELPEITLKSGDREYKFSDGVGMISRDLAKEVRQALAVRNVFDDIENADLYEPSAFQIRFKGCKGMLAESTTLKGRKIGIRPSMKKFDCDSSNALEIVKISAPRSVYLNRPLITILENLGIKDRVFLELQKNFVFKLTDALIYEEEACKMLENCTSMKFPFKKIYQSGVHLTTEPFFRSLLLCVYKSLINNLKHKSRIAISPKYGRNMLGVVDETRTLEYGQIFAQYSQQVGNISSPLKVLKGTVVVTKNPCMHPGDVRKFEAVDVKALHHIKDCIVFPAKGKRPHPDEMAGSDLDGDEYVLLWDKRLIFSRDNYEPMEYPPNKENNLGRPIKLRDMIDFMCTYIEDDHIGQMANAYLAWADYNKDGIFSEVCMKIAHKYPQALDFAKSGTTQCLEPEERPKLYPDFMEKGSQNNSYKSEKTLGLLYRVIRNLEASVSNINDEIMIAHDINLEEDGWEMFESIAKSRRDQYSKRVNNILVKFGLTNEAEAFTGYISDINDCNRNKYERENISLISKKYLVDNMKCYRMKFLKDCEKEKVKHPELRRKEIQYLMASAWYMVTYRGSITDYKCSILSFPWVVSECLHELRIRKDRRVITKSMLIHNYDTFLLSLKEKVRERDNTDCDCVSILHHTTLDWVKSSSFILTASSKDVFCMGCFNRIVMKFRRLKMLCCSGNNCTCSHSCSPLKLILEFFKYYASEIISAIGICGQQIPTGGICQGFRDFNLQSLALKTYAVIAVSQNLPYLEGSATNEASTEIENIEEGDPIRLRVTDTFEQVLTNNIDEVSLILKELSGVEKVFITGDDDRTHSYILVNSIGKAHNRWNLEELIMDSKCPSILRDRLDNSCIVPSSAI